MFLFFAKLCNIETKEEQSAFINLKIKRYAPYRIFLIISRKREIDVECNCIPRERFDVMRHHVVQRILL